MTRHSVVPTFGVTPRQNQEFGGFWPASCERRVSENLADKARVLGIPVWRFGGA
jgi:hypothetical protein